MSKRSRRTKGIEEARPFAGMSRINEDAAGVDIGAIEIVACVAGDENTQIVKAFGNYTVDLHAISRLKAKKLLQMSQVLNEFKNNTNPVRKKIAWVNFLVWQM